MISTIFDDLFKERPRATSVGRIVRCWIPLCKKLLFSICFQIDAGYDGGDVDKEGDIMKMQPFKKNSAEHIALNCSLAAGFWPSACVLYKKGSAPSYWYTMAGESVSAFRGSANSDYIMKRDSQDGRVVRCGTPAGFCQ